MLAHCRKAAGVNVATKESVIGCNWASFSFVMSRSESRDHDWSNTHHVMCKNKQCCLVLSVLRHVPGEHGIT